MGVGNKAPLLQIIITHQNDHMWVDFERLWDPLCFEQTLLLYSGAQRGSWNWSRSQSQCTAMGPSTPAPVRRAGFYLCFINNSLYIFSPFPFWLFISSVGWDSFLQCLHRPLERQPELSRISIKKSSIHISAWFFRANLATFVLTVS